jgi:hypothetical protein
VLLGLALVAWRSFQPLRKPAATPIPQQPSVQPVAAKVLPQPARPVAPEQAPVKPAIEHHFDFRSADDYARFCTLFDKTLVRRMEMKHENGRIVFRRDASDPNRPDGSLHLHAGSLTLGRHWELKARVDLRIGLDEVAAGTDGKSYRRADFHMRFLKAGEQPQPDCDSHLRFYLGVLTAYNGYFCCALRNHQQYNNARGAGWGLLEGAENPGPFGDHFLDKGKAKPPASPDGKYTVELIMDYDELIAIIDGAPAFNTMIPRAAAEIIAASPPAFFFDCSKETTEVYLEELHLKIIPPEADSPPRNAAKNPEF